MTSLDERYGEHTEGRLRDVAALCRRAEQLAGRGREWYDSDPELQVPRLAADSLVLKLGEAVRRLPDAFLEDHHADPEWRRAIGMRRRIAHDYDAVDYELVWGVVSRHAGELRRRVEALLIDAT
ncbi:HepT-like ribonuclease domain-containing protein [Serinicoccus kebangsaanensis]|uniref:HepT-like ribonuclease domain-containing protein n=1 Tax=Serinicoccus kebangsaanensis TaxID=2602069 RepID=UPI00124E528B|nr:HepT-like ribonuclease domain-containing protein [Serinicoccus kebangsaanensis]